MISRRSQPALSRAAILASLAVGNIACSSSTVEPAAGRSIVLLFTSDEHSHLLAFGPELDDYPLATAAGTGALKGGVARRATVLGRERDAAKAAGKASLTVSAGDNQMGCLPHVAFESASIDYGTMKELGYDVTTFGNHEFDFGPKSLAASLTAAKAGSGMPAIVSTNIHFSDESDADDALAALYSKDPKADVPVHAYRVVTTDNGLKVGFIGYLGSNAEYVAPNKVPVRFSGSTLDVADEGNAKKVLPKLYAELQPAVDTLRDAEKVNLVVALSHSGISDSSTPESIKNGEDYKVAENVSGIDVIVSGHSHNPDARPIVVTNKASGQTTLVLNGSSFGQHVGRVELTVPDDPAAHPTWDPATQALLPVDDTVLPHADHVHSLDEHLATIEKAGIPKDKPFLEGILSRAFGKAVKDDTTKAGDLYFYPLGKTDYDVTDLGALTFLSADSMLAAADVLGKKTDMALEAGGAIRSTISTGKTGVIAAADAFNIVPLGSSPFDGTMGYGLVRAKLSLFELRIVFELSLARGKKNPDLLLGQAGMQVQYDATRPALDPANALVDALDSKKGQVMVIKLDTDHADGFEQFDTVIYDREKGTGDPSAAFSIVTSMYIAQFAGEAGATLKDDTGLPASLEDVLLHYPDGAEVKQLEAFFGYLKAAPGGKLSDRYDPKAAGATKRMLCLKGC